MQLVIQLELGLPELSEGLLVAQKELGLVIQLVAQKELELVMKLVAQKELGLVIQLVVQKELELVMKLAVQLEKGCFQSSEEECFRMFRMSPFWKIRILHQI